MRLYNAIQEMIHMKGMEKDMINMRDIGKGLEEFGHDELFIDRMRPLCLGSMHIAMVLPE